MSWNLPPAILTVGALEANQAALQNQREQWENMNQGAEGEALEQIQAAQDMAFTLTSDASPLGPVGAIVRFQASGHANPGHQPRKGYANDYINFNLAQESPVATVAAEGAESTAD